MQFNNIDVEIYKEYTATLNIYRLSDNSDFRSAKMKKIKNTEAFFLSLKCQRSEQPATLGI